MVITMNNMFCGIEKLSLVDYDNKLSCTLFTNYCNFQCDFCHNALLLKEEQYLTWNEIKEYLESRKRMLDAVVISGGEPTLKPQLFDVCKEIKAMGFLIKLDTNGTNPHVLKKLIEEKLVDYIAMDIKNDEAGYDLVTKVKTNMDKIKESIKLIMNSNIDYEFINSNGEHESGSISGDFTNPLSNYTSALTNFNIIKGIMSDDFYGLSGLILTPLSYIQTLSSQVCTPISFPVPFTNKNISLPCFSSIYSTYIPDILNIWHIVIYGIICYAIGVNLFKTIKDSLEFDKNDVEVLDL